MRPLALKREGGGRGIALKDELCINIDAHMPKLYDLIDTHSHMHARTYTHKHNYQGYAYIIIIHALS